MDMEVVSGIAAVVTTTILGWFGKKWKDEWEERQAAKRVPPPEEEPHAPGRNGKTVSFEHCQAQMQIIGQRFDTVIGNQAEQRTDVQELTKAIFDWKDTAVEKLADHGARIGALERRTHGTR